VRVKKCCVRGVWGVLQWLPFYAAESCYDLGIQGYSKVALNLAVLPGCFSAFIGSLLTTVPRVK
jgi:hypothetical protein